MAETVVGLLIEKLIPLLGEEAYLLRGVHTEVEGIKCDLDFMMAFLNEADTRAEADHKAKGNEGIRAWVRKLREATFELEYVIDEYTHLMAQQRRSHRIKFIGFLRKGTFLIVKLKPRHDIASRIRDIKRRVRDINVNGQAYGFNSSHQRHKFASGNNNWSDPRKDACFLEEAEVVGIESARDDLVGRLESESPRRAVVSLVGMGGLGKTTLAHQVYERVKGNFECHAWIVVSQSYSPVELLRILIKKICLAREEFAPAGIDAMDEHGVTVELRDYLKGKRYIVFFDDVWNINFWTDIKNALPDDDKACGRIVITTRYVEVANFCKTSFSYVHIHRLKELTPKKSWELFCKKAFHSEPNKNCPSDLKDLSLKIVERCHGLPLAIVVIAGLLSTKNKSVVEWRNLETCLRSELDNNEHLTSIKRILSLSYNDLPYHLKSCFLYFGIFPEDCSVRHGRLIRQWIAEGFVTPDNYTSKTLEMVAEEYLVELINRSLVQVSKVKLDGKAKSCRVHDVLREIILKKVEDLSFCQASSQNCSDAMRETQRISVLQGSYSLFQNKAKVHHVRSVFTFSREKRLNEIVDTMVRSFKHLKLLDFENASCLDHLPKDIGRLFHLRYLSVRGTRVKFLPESIRKLENLETLDLKQSLISTLPVEINRLHKLRHLLTYHIDYNMDSLVSVHKGVRILKGIGSLKALQKLYFIEANVAGFDVFEELVKLTELRKLGLKMLTSQDGKKLCQCIQTMEHLESLSLASGNEHELIELEAMSLTPQFLRHLNLDCRLEKLPEWIKGLTNLVRLRLGWSKLEDDPLKSLQNLPNLIELGMYYDAYHGKKLNFKEMAFPKLKVLCLGDLSQLSSVTIEEGALCELERFLIGSCPKLEKVPSGVRSLRSLKVLGFMEMPIEFLMFQDFRSLETIPNVRFAHISDGEYTAFGLKSITMIQNIMREHHEIEWEASHFEGLLRHNGVEWECSHFEEFLSKVRGEVGLTNSQSA